MASTIIIWNYARLNCVCYYTRPPPTFLGGFYLDKIDNYPQLSCTLHALAVFFIEVAAGTNDVRWFLRFLHDFTRNQTSCTIPVCSQIIFLRQPRTTAVFWTCTFFFQTYIQTLSISRKRLEIGFVYVLLTLPDVRRLKWSVNRLETVRSLKSIFIPFSKWIINNVFNLTMFLPGSTQYNSRT